MSQDARFWRQTNDDMARQALYLSVFISYSSNARDKKNQVGRLYIERFEHGIELCPKDSK